MKSHGPKHVDLIINSFQSSWFLKTLSKTGSVHHGHAWKPSHAVGLIWAWSQDQTTHFWSGFYLVWALNDAQSRVPKIPVVSREPLAALPGSGWTETFQTTTNALSSSSDHHFPNMDSNCHYSQDGKRRGDLCFGVDFLNFALLLYKKRQSSQWEIISDSR